VAAIMNMVGQTVALDEKSAELFEQLVHGLLAKPNERDKYPAKSTQG